MPSPSRRRWLLLLALILAVACSPKPRRPAVAPYALPEELAREDHGVLHEVGPDQSWESLAADYYGDSGQSRDLRQANPKLGDSPQVGEMIFIPLSPAERQAFETRAEARGLYNLGLDLAESGRYPDAIVQFETALTLDDRLAEAHYNLGLVYRRLDRGHLSAEHLNRAVHLRPRNADYRYAQGLTLLEVDPKRAERSFRKALDLDGRHLGALYALAELLEGRGKLREARPFWERYLELDPDSPRGEEARHRLSGLP